MYKQLPDGLKIAFRAKDRKNFVVNLSLLKESFFFFFSIILRYQRLPPCILLTSFNRGGDLCKWYAPGCGLLNKAGNPWETIQINTTRATETIRNMGLYMKYFHQAYIIPP